MTFTTAYDRAKSEILADVRCGVQPVMVKDFAELHDHADANEYGGACEENDQPAEFWADVHEAVDAWIKGGGIAEVYHVEVAYGFDVFGDPCVYLQMLDSDGEHVRYLSESEARRHLLKHG